MRIYDIISDKRNANELTTDQISFFVSGITDGSIPDYQASALLMAICINGMTDEETYDLTMSMANSGEIADLSKIKGTVIDKHSSGGVGDKCTLIVGPIVSSLGIPFAKLSGRGLGHTGGTIDKLESIKGFKTKFSLKEFIDKVNKTGIVIAGQTGELAPADKKLYALRNDTATVDSIPLIAASIMSKKIAAGADSILLDVKCGNGAFMEDITRAEELAKLMVKIGKQADKKMKAFVTNMNQPLGYCIGNGLEVMEAYNSLSGNGPKDLMEICIALSAGMIELAGFGSYNDCKDLALKSIRDGSALKQFGKMVISQGGKLHFNGTPVLTGNARYEQNVYSDQEGIVNSILTKRIGEASMILGAGREKKDDVIDPAAGIFIHKKLGDSINLSEKIATFYTNRSNVLKEVDQLIKSSYEILLDKPVNEEYILNIYD
ncbi:MAG: thymidine phosphorylase [Saccharofermentanales bacterium]